ncbi:DUF3267 domain-containing protein [Sphingobacterium wenxiniae]|uniref:Putative zincin peptidase n=1 Tax=Sphingobacterium wenxiniae TaxID=683125 RepID=A0A1I6VT00_9SPHI|nr:DUF3267 domain-containing protein [Sphingobacterium wenxiniae]SFT16817.1 Putative zincin peptidase [Sphingobacterium wenxiniae]
MEENQYIKEQRTIDLAKANAAGCLFYFPVIAFFGIIYYIIWREEFSWSKVNEFFIIDLPLYVVPFVIVLVLVAGIVLHELIHGVTWALYAKQGWKSIKFGVLWKYMAPYCHCKEPLSVRAYAIGAAMPGILMGILPGVVSWFTGSLFLLSFGIFFTVAAIGDIMIIRLILKEDKGALVQDHPSEAGYFVFKKVDNGS